MKKKGQPRESPVILFAFIPTNENHTGGGGVAVVMTKLFPDRSADRLLSVYDVGLTMLPGNVEVAVTR